MLKYSLEKRGALDWITKTPQQWAEWYRQFRQTVKEVPTEIGKKLYDLLQIVVATSQRNYLTGGGHSTKILNVRTGRLRSSITAKVLKKMFVLEGSVGTDVGYGKVHEEGGTFDVRGHYRTITKVFGKSIPAKRIFISAYKMNMPKRAFIEPAVKDNIPRITRTLEQLGIIFQ